ncbi:MAG TPA: diadenylate cyclase CdaA [Bryobacteraceae bacterium]|nr:diadenylate cyclase CdaA [Bryobacteraceae bacterium]
MTYWLRFLRSTPTLSLTGIIDLLVVAVVVYQCLMVVRGTRAGHILVGILMMVSLYAVAAWAGLEALRSLLETIVPFLGLAIIVLFASEIRRTLARIGRKRWFGLARGYRAPEAVSEIQMAVELLAQQQIGALIVLERDIGLRTFIESGVRLDALVSRDLLLSIFQPGPPLHDGAVVVQKDRVAAAACFLPLTTQPTFARKLGTRHRAAIGITEETDCLALVVSEESGRLSVASFGELASGLTVAEMMERIHHHFGAARPTAPPPEEFPAGIVASAQPPETGEAPQGRTIEP